MDKVELLNNQEEKVHLTLLLVTAISAVTADFILLTNFKAFLLITVGTVLVILYNYIASIGAIERTDKKYHAGIFANWRWYKEEWGVARKVFLCAAVLSSAIIIFWYYPRHYTVNWFGLIIVLLIVPSVSIIAGILGTKRGLVILKKKHGLN